MNTFASKVGGLLLVALFLVPTGAQAYRFVDNSAHKVSDTTYLLTHTYTAGFLNEDAKLPIVASLEYSETDTYPRVGFSVVSNNPNVEGAEVNAIVLSEAPIVDNQYQTLAGSRSTFTLMALVTVKQPVVNSDELSLSVDSLPFSYQRDGVEKTGSYTENVVEVNVGDIKVEVTPVGK